MFALKIVADVQLMIFNVRLQLCRKIFQLLDHFSQFWCQRYKEGFLSQIVVNTYFLVSSKLENYRVQPCEIIV